MTNEQQNPDIRPEMPWFSDGKEGADWKYLQLVGQVSNPLALTLQDLARLPQLKMTYDFQCEEGWTVLDQVWEGVSFWTVLDMAGPLSQSKFASFQAGDFKVALTLEEARDSNMLLALRLNGQPLRPEHGGPCRLLSSSQKCYLSVKWLDRIEVTAVRPQETALQHIRARGGL